MQTIEICDKNGIKKVMEIINVFRIEKYKSNYIIYRELDKSKNYVAKYYGDKMLDLDTNLNEDELKLCNEVFERIGNNE